MSTEKEKEFTSAQVGFQATLKGFDIATALKEIRVTPILKSASDVAQSIIPAVQALAKPVSTAALHDYPLSYLIELN